MPTTREHGARANHGGTMTKTAARARANARALGDVPSQLAELDTMNVGSLAEKYRDLYGEPTRSRPRRRLSVRMVDNLDSVSRSVAMAVALNQT